MWCQVQGLVERQVRPKVYYKKIFFRNDLNIFFQHLAITRVYFYSEFGNEETFFTVFCNISKRNLFVLSSDVAGGGVECLL